MMRLKKRRIDSIVRTSGLSYACVRALIDQARPLYAKTANKLAKAIGCEPEDLMVPSRVQALRVEVSEPRPGGILAESELSLLVELCKREEEELRGGNRNVLADMYAGISAKLLSGGVQEVVQAAKTEPVAKEPRPAPAEAATVKPERSSKPKSGGGGSAYRSTVSVPLSRPFTWNEVKDLVMLSADGMGFDEIAQLMNRPVSDVKVLRCALPWAVSAVTTHKWPEARIMNRLREWLPKKHPAFLAKE